MREWTELSFGSNKTGELWIELWDTASQVDFAAAQCRTDEELLSMLGSSDTMEMHLRRLASLKYKARTGDQSGAAHMMALQAPGGSSDVAPPWIVAEATLHSKTEWQRADRVQKDRSAAAKAGAGRGDQGRGRGDGGKGGRGRGRGKGDQQGAPPK